MLELVKKYWFIIALATAALLGYVYPRWGLALQEYDLIQIGIFFSFLATGLELETQSVLRQITAVKALIVALFSSLLLYPVIAYGAARPLLPEEMAVGIAIVAAAPVTVSSGTILTAVALGNVALSLLICIFSNLLALFSMPLVLGLMLGVGHRIDLPTLHMLGGLATTVLLPITIGQLLRLWLKNIIRRWNRQLVVFQSAIIILIIFNAVSSSAGNLDGMRTLLPGVVLFVIALHLTMLVVNYRIAGLLGLDRASTVAFTIHTSQKALAVSYIVWSGYFAASYPAAIVPAISFHLAQMVIGTLIANHFRKQRKRQENHI